jgi:hypothetical protein
MPILYGVVYGGYSTFRSGRPGSLKSYKAANFIFFMQTMQLLGKDTGYFMGKSYYKDAGKKQFVDTANEVASFFSLSLTTATDSAELVCPIKLDTYWQMYVNVGFQSVWVLLCTAGYYFLFHLLCSARLVYVLQMLLHKLSGGKLCPAYHWNVNQRIRVRYTSSEEEAAFTDAWNAKRATEQARREAHPGKRSTARAGLGSPGSDPDGGSPSPSPSSSPSPSPSSHIPTQTFLPVEEHEGLFAHVEAEVELGLGRIVDLHGPSPILHQIYEEIWCLCF